MYLIVGLGNPGKKYKNTRHNAGFLVIEELQSANNFSNWRKEKKFQAQISKGKINTQEIILVKPEVFMNESGKLVKLVIRNLKLEIENLWVIHDDIDLPLGKIKISQGRGSGGHKGVQSIIDNLKTKDFVRFRIGIAPKIKPENVEKFVLEDFNREEKEILKKVIKRTIELIKLAVSSEKGLEKAISKL